MSLSDRTPAAWDGAVAGDGSFIEGREATAIGAAAVGWACDGVTCRIGVTEPIHINDPKVTANMASLMSSERTMLGSLSREMNGPPMNVFHGFHKAFGKGRVRVNHVGDA